ncbi:MAG: hypothetical protein QOI24_1279 [Acidobacteriota bacterium]|jgi:hypothetical protein|nr:hypothetical protein [Acidobacteriota bacterium]
MKKIAAIIVLLLAACASSSKDGKPAFPQPELQLGQANEPSDFLYSNGTVRLRYALEITNNADQQLTLRRIELRSTSGGYYQLPTRSEMFNLAIPPHSTETATFAMWGTATGSMRTHVVEPTTLRGVAYFDTPTGPMQKLFTSTIDLAGR